MMVPSPRSQAVTTREKALLPPNVRQNINALREPLTKEQASLFDSCQGLVRSLAWRIHSKMGQMVELDDLIAYGQLGLVEAARNFDADRKFAFVTFAHYRIRGAILDGLEKLRWFKMAAFHGSQYEHLGRDFMETEGDPENAQKDTKEGNGKWLVKTTRALAVSYILSGDSAAANAEMIEDESARPPGAELMSEELRALVRRAIDGLPLQVAQLIRSTYFEGLNLKEAGERLGISKAWASRLHARALGMLATKLETMGYEHEHS